MQRRMETMQKRVGDTVFPLLSFFFSFLFPVWDLSISVFHHITLIAIDAVCAYSLRAVYCSSIVPKLTLRGVKAHITS